MPMTSCNPLSGLGLRFLGGPWMPKVVVRNFACSLDGFGAGLQQSQSEPFGKNAKVHGGVSTVRAFWRARLLDELHLVMAPVFVGEGERLLGGLGVEGDYQVAGFEASEAAVHYRIVKTS